MANQGDSNVRREARGKNKEFFKFVEALHRISNEVGILACQFDSVGSPVDICADPTIARNVPGQVDAVGEQEESAKLQFGI